MQFSFQFFTLICSSVFALAPLEPVDGSPIYIGAWWDRLNQQTPNIINEKLGRNLSLWQSDVNISSTLQADAMDQIFSQIEDTKTDALVYLTVYPIMGFGNVSDAAIAQFTSKIKDLTSKGTKLYIRYASEMNGAWFAYGQQPTAFKESWIKIVRLVREAAGAENVAFIWAPNSANGYPYKRSPFSVTPTSPNWDPSLDTNGDGEYDLLDDPFSPFYPGDEWVDWVGMSLYHYGDKYPWIQNTVPEAGKAESIMTGTFENTNGVIFNFYEMFCASGRGGQPRSVSAGGKPMIITETSATIHVAGLGGEETPVFIPINQNPESRALIKQTWWRQMINPNFLTKYSKIKAICFFEFFKFEEVTYRDFTVFGGDGNLTSPFNNDGAAMNGATLEAFKSDMNGDLGKLVRWASPGTAGITGSGRTTVGSGENSPFDHSMKYMTLVFTIMAVTFLF